MKFIAIFLIFIFSSCIKERHCDCAAYYNGVGTKGYRSVDRTTKKSFEKECLSHNVEIDQNGNGQICHAN